MCSAAICVQGKPPTVVRTLLQACVTECQAGSNFLKQAPTLCTSCIQTEQNSYPQYRVGHAITLTLPRHTKPEIGFDWSPMQANSTYKYSDTCGRSSDATPNHKLHYKLHHPCRDEAVAQCVCKLCAAQQLAYPAACPCCMCACHQRGHAVVWL